MTQLFDEVVVAGTFDRLHDGHQQLLQTALQSGKKVFCGLTVPEINKNKILSETIQSYLVRKNTLQSYNRKMAIFPLSDPFGPAIEKNGLEAIVAAWENQATIEKINYMRTSKKLKALYPLYVNLSDAQDRQKISSTRIRLGEINRTGRVFSRIFKAKKIVLPVSQRTLFQKPFGKLWPMEVNKLDKLAQLVQLALKQPTPLTITVGDIVTQAFTKLKLPVSLSIIDYRSQRQPLNQSYHKKLLTGCSSFNKVNNQPGTLNLALIEKLQALFLKIIFTRQKQVLEISGEEDLTVLPVVLLAPLGALVFYGQPNQGVVKIRVTEAHKQKAYQLLSRFAN